MTDLVGTTIENTYRIEKLLGEGGMGAVYQARELSLDRAVAIKVMHPSLAQQPGFAERFLQEARAIAKLDHPHIVRVLSFSRSADLLYIAMRYVEGQNLRDWLHLAQQRHQRLAIVEALAIAEVLAEALHYAHRRGVYHRDIKPGNVILEPLETGETTPQGLPYAPVITDFGLAKLAEDAAHSTAAQPVGTPRYMAPEQCLGQPVDGRTDLHSLGVVLYEMLTGQPPHAAHTIPEAIRAHSQGIRSPRELRPELTAEIEAALRVSLAKDPSERYQTGAAMAAALQALRATAAQGAATSPPDPTLAALPADDQPTPVPEAAPATGDAMSIATLIGGQAPPPTPARDAWPTPPAEVPAHGRLLALGPDGTTVALPLQPDAPLIIGREPDCDMPLPDPGLSRRHAQVRLREHYVELTDLGSTNGTYLAERRLLPGIAERWEPHEQARLGAYWIRLEPAQAAAAPANATAKPAEDAATPTPVPGARSVSTDLTYLAIDPGEPVLRAGHTSDVVVRIMNRQPTPEQFIITLDGLPTEWIAGLDGGIELPPGDMKALTLRITPPADATPELRPVRVVARPRFEAEAEAAIDARAQIEPARLVHMDVDPPHRGGQQGLVRLENRSTRPQTVILRTHAPANALQVALERTQVRLGPGEQDAVPLTTQALTRRPLLGVSHKIPFAVTADTAEGDRMRVTSRVVRRPAVPLAVLLLVLLVVLAAFVAGMISFARRQMPIAQPPPSTATLTPTGQATPTIDAAATATAAALAAFAEEEPTHTPTSTATATPSATPGVASPTPTATETPPPPPPEPTWTPCPYELGPALAPLWDREAFGCPVAPLQAGDWGYQPMERGMLFWSGERDSIIMLANDGRWREALDDWDESKPELSCEASPPAGLIQPKRGFGLAWCTQPDWRDTLGYAVVIEEPTDARLQTLVSGHMLYHVSRDTAYLLRTDGTWVGLAAP